MIKVKNDGNTDNGPTKVGLTFFDQYHSTQLGQQEENVTEKVKSFQTEDISVDFPNNLEVGQYWADVKIYSGDAVAVDSKIVFNVGGAEVAKNINQKPVSFSMPNLSAIPFWIYLIIAAVIVILVLVVIIIVLVFHKEERHVAKKKKAADDKEEFVKKLKIHEDK